MTSTDLIGYLASLLVLMTFCMQGMVALRLLAIASNLAFIGYGLLADIQPVLFLHVLLLPTNVYRLAQMLRGQQRQNHARKRVGCVLRTDANQQ
jgi:CRP/FNR family transcriptional regulator, cyclic AMP receptor protein